MKNMIVTMAILIFALTMLNCQNQCSHLLRTKSYLCEIAAEAAQAAFWQQDTARGKEVAEKIITLNLQKKVRDAKWHVQYIEIEPGQYTVTVTLEYERLCVTERAD